MKCSLKHKYYTAGSSVASPVIADLWKEMTKHYEGSRKYPVGTSGREKTMSSFPLNSTTVKDHETFMSMIDD